MTLDDVKVNIGTRFHIEGSALKGTIRGGPLEFLCDVKVASSEPPERIAHLLQVSENSCYVMQSLMQPVTFKNTVSLNGAAFDPGAHPLPYQREAPPRA